MTCTRSSLALHSMLMPIANMSRGAEKANTGSSWRTNGPPTTSGSVAMKKEYVIGLVKMKKCRTADGRGTEFCAGDGTFLIPGTKKKQYTMQLGEGTYGVVVLAKCKRSGDFVAIKRMSPQTPKMMERAMREVINLQKIGSHPNIVQMEDFFHDDEKNELHIVLKYYKHGDLEKYRLSQPTETLGGVEYATLNEKDLEVVLFSACRALVHMHVKCNVVSSAR